MFKVVTHSTDLMRVLLRYGAARHAEIEDEMRRRRRLTLRY